MAYRFDVLDVNFGKRHVLASQICFSIVNPTEPRLMAGTVCVRLTGYIIFRIYSMLTLMRLRSGYSNALTEDF